MRDQKTVVCLLEKNLNLPQLEVIEELQLLKKNLRKVTNFCKIRKLRLNAMPIIRWQLGELRRPNFKTLSVIQWFSHYDIMINCLEPSFLELSSQMFPTNIMEMCLRYLNIFIYLFIYLFSVCCNPALEFNQIYLYSVIYIYNCNFKIHL